MTTHLFSHQEDRTREHASTEEIQERIKPDWHEFNVTNGGEFLDDAIRTIDQPLTITAVKDNE